jgi:hypothetical protein
MNELQRNKRTIRAFLQSAYSDGKLTELLDHARSGMLAYESCCCFIGILTATHTLRGYDPGVMWDSHVVMARSAIEGAQQAERAFCDIGYPTGYHTGDDLRRKRLIPMILHEIKRRVVTHNLPPLTNSTKENNNECINA